MRRTFFFIVAVCLATSSFASIPRASALDVSSPRFDPLPETRIRVSADLAPFERPAGSELTRALRQGYGQASTTNASGLARFLSVDPAGFDPHRPQSWNRYSYVTNNPINKVDPDGRAELDFTLTTRIPMRVVAVPGGRFFHGDLGSTTFRTQQTFRVETDPARARGGSPLISQRNVAGQTIEYDKSGKVIGTGMTTQVGRVTASFQDGQPVVNVMTSSPNPLITGAPTIDNSLTITGPASGKTVSVTGTLDGFPSTTLTMTNEKGQTSTIFHFDPRTVGNGPMSLLPVVGDQKVDVNCTDTGKCNGGVRP